MKQFYRLAALFLALLLLCGCAAGNGYGKPERKEGQDQYLTDPVPEGKPQPVEPQDVTVSDTEYTCTISISCASILEHMDPVSYTHLSPLSSARMRLSRRS